jgi:outer membrane protein OmpA-like peptidoglycan-associated protein
MPVSLLKPAFFSLSIVLLALTTTAIAESVKVEGLITGRSGDQMIVQLAPDAELAFQLDDHTQVSQSKGIAALIPGLKVKVEGTYTEARLLVATSVKFKDKDLEHAKAVEAGSFQVKQQSEEHTAELERQRQALEAQNKALLQQQEQVQEQQAKIAANKAQIEANAARFGQLDDYYIYDEVTLYFGNGQVKVDPKYNEPLMTLADKAKSVEGYMIEVVGYASTSGSEAANQKLSEQRADNVTNILVQQAHVPQSRMLAPGAMGESQPVGNEKTSEGQAESRRVVVRVLQNKAIAGTEFAKTSGGI